MLLKFYFSRKIGILGFFVITFTFQANMAKMQTKKQEHFFHERRATHFLSESVQVLKLELTT